MEHEPEGTQNALVKAAMWNIRIDAATAELLGALSAAGIRSVILKGPALTDWYAPESVRTYVDGDVWVAPGDETAAAAVLKGLGFVPDLEVDELPDWWLDHATAWRRQADRAAIDLHRKLQGVGIDPHNAWEVLWPTTEELIVAGERGRRLPAPARALYVSLHAAHHGAGYRATHRHLEAALSAVDAQTWQSAAELARKLDAVDMFAAGLRLVPAGVAVADHLGLPTGGSVKSALYASTPPPVALGFDQLATARGAQRLSILTRKLFPPPTFVRHWWPPAKRGPLMLAVGYAYRPVWLATKAPTGWRAWRQARREVQLGARDASSER